MDGWKRMVWTVGLVFFVTVAQSFINAGGDLFAIDMSLVQIAVNAGVGAVLALVINFVSPWISQYGVGSE
jgi:hypothetical protein